MKDEQEGVLMAKLTNENGEEMDLEVVAQIDHKDKKYAVLYDSGCECEEECECDEECNHNDKEAEGYIYIFEVTKDKDDKEALVEVDESMMEELLPIIEKELYLSGE